MDTVPKTMQAKARRLMEHLKRDIAWNARGELIHEGVSVTGSNVVDLVNDILRKRKTDPTGWQPFAQQLRAINLPMELVCNVARRAYIRQVTYVVRARNRQEPHHHLRLLRHAADRQTTVDGPAHQIDLWRR